jgi:hypothetical protein
MTPAMARSFSKAYLRYGLDADVLMDEAQEQRMIQAMSRTIMGIAHEHAETGRDFFEFTFQKLVRNDRDFSPDEAREYAKRAAPLVPAFQTFLKTTDADARDILDDSQYEELAEALRRKTEAYDRFAEKMQRWSEGEVAENEQPFLDPRPPETSTTRAADRAQERKFRSAQRRARREIRSFAFGHWERFLREAEKFFDFSGEQREQGRRLLLEAKHDASTVMTPQWRRSMELNRMKYHLAKMTNQPVEPYLHQLHREHEDLSEPVNEIGRRFETAVLGLTTDEQRTEAVARLREFAQTHGMTVVADIESLLTRPTEN